MISRPLDLASSPLSKGRFLLVVPVLMFSLAGCANNRPVSVQAEQNAVSQDVAGLPDQQAVKNSNVPLLIRMQDSVAPADAQALFKKYDCTVIQQIPPKTGTLWSLDAPKTKTKEQWIALMQSQPGVTSAEVDLTRVLVVPLEQ